jgi:hypothetical protein
LHAIAESKKMAEGLLAKWWKVWYPFLSLHKGMHAPAVLPLIFSPTGPLGYQSWSYSP